MHTFLHTPDDPSRDVTGQNIPFRCSTCGLFIQFNRPEVGSPSAVQTADGWTTPDNPDQWCDPCSVS